MGEAGISMTPRIESPSPVCHCAREQTLVWTLTSSILIGDQLSDIDAARAAGVGTRILLRPGPAEVEVPEDHYHISDSLDKIRARFVSLGLREAPASVYLQVTMFQACRYRGCGHVINGSGALECSSCLDRQAVCLDQPRAYRPSQLGPFGLLVSNCLFTATGLCSLADRNSAWTARLQL